MSCPTPHSDATLPASESLLPLRTVASVHPDPRDPEQRGRIPHLMGSETEYGIVAADAPEVSPIVTSTQAVVAFAEVTGQGINRRTRWDYEDESPLRDARGFDLRRYRSGGAPVLDPNAVGAANVITTSGARFYVDHAHPEYSSPEVTSAWDLVIWDQAGDRIMHQAAVASGAQPDQPQLKIYKNNVDGKGASYGAHENYLYPRDTDLEALHAALTLHFVTRQVFTGAGRVGLGVSGEESGFQISQRADYIETDVSLETTLNRGIINTRDEPHADHEAWRRLHVIIGDANLSEFATYLKFGTTALLIRAVQAGLDVSDLRLYEPVAAVREVSRDLSCRTPLRFYGNVEHTAIAVQRMLRQRILDVLRPLDSRADAAPGVRPTLSPDDEAVLALWEEILDALEHDPLSTADRLDWTAKYALLSGYHARGVAWDDPRMMLIDLQYSDIDPEKGLYHALVRRGRMRTLVPAEAVEQAVTCPPRTTRAWLRGHLVAHYHRFLLSANWDNLILDVPYEDYAATKLSFRDPFLFAQEEVAAVGGCGQPEGERETLLAIIEQLRRLHPEALSGVGQRTHPASEGRESR